MNKYTFNCFALGLLVKGNAKQILTKGVALRRWDYSKIQYVLHTIQYGLLRICTVHYGSNFYNNVSDSDGKIWFRVLASLAFQLSVSLPSTCSSM